MISLGKCIACIVVTVLGSCVAVCLWAPEVRVGGMNHYLLPERHGRPGAPGRYGDEATDELLQRSRQAVGRGRALVAKFFGGGSRLRAAGGEQPS